MKTKRTLKLQLKLVLLCAISFSVVQVGYANNLTTNYINSLWQDQSINGTVTDETGQPLPGVTVIEKGTSNGVSTDFNGKYTINLSSTDAVLLFSYVGYSTQEISVGNQTTIDVQMKIDSELDEVVVIGYGSISKSNTTTAVASIKSKDFEDIPVTSIEQAIASQLPGVEITQNSGQPGVTNGITVRGLNSITAGTSPLIVVDGLPLSEGSSLNSINPNDVASFEVLKDAAAAAIYGSRAGGGVILITTKKGTSEKPIYSYNSFIGFQQVAQELDLMNAYEHAIWSRDARNNYYFQFNDGSFSVNDSNAIREANASTFGFNSRKAIIPSFIQPYLTGQTGLTDTDWQDEIFRNALIQNHQISVRGGSEKMSYYVSGDYLEQEGIVIGSNFERFSFRTNFNVELSEKLNFGFSLNPSLIQEDLIQTGFNTSPINAAIMSLPYFSAYNADGSLNISQQVVDATEGDQARSENPVALATLIDDERRTFGMQGGTFLEYEIIEGLKAKTYFGIEYTDIRRDFFNPSIVGQRNVAAPDDPFGFTSNEDRTNWLIENTLSYARTFNEKHNFNAFVGYTFQEESTSVSVFNAEGFPNDIVQTLNAGQLTSGTGVREKSVLISYLGRVQYDYDGKYLLTAAMRRDGSSRFGNNTKWGNFPSLSLGYNISKEDFFPESDLFTNLKLRASWGVAGNNQVGNYASQALLEFTNTILGNAVQNGVSPASSPNAYLGWEETTTIDFGIDFGLFNNKISGSIDYYDAETKDLLLDVPVPAHSGFDASTQNIGRIENKGWEILLKGSYGSGDFRASTTLNFATNQNKVLELGPGQEEIITGRNITRIGGELGASYGYRTNGVFTSQEQIDNTPSLPNAQVGEYIYADSNGDGVINSDDRVVLGSIFPDFTYGINQTFNYKNFDLGIVVQGVEGAHLHDRTVSVLLFNPEGWNNGHRDYFNGYYTPERGTNSVYARPNTVPTDNGFYRESDVLQDDASFLRIRNITLGYTLPDSVNELLNISKMRLYFSSKNPFTFTDYRGYNPEQRSGNALSPTTGFDNYPVEKSFVFGVNVNF